jgi:hypothetical protein
VRTEINRQRAAVINRRALSVHQFMAKSERGGEKSVAEWTCVAREHFIPRPRARHATAAISTIVNARFISSLPKYVERGSGLRDQNNRQTILAVHIIPVD